MEEIICSVYAELFGLSLACALALPGHRHQISHSCRECRPLMGLIGKLLNESRPLYVAPTNRSLSTKWIAKGLLLLCDCPRFDLETSGG